MTDLKGPPPGSQRIIPHLNYRDAPGAIAFLTEAFGFEELYRLPMPDGRIGHAELSLGGDAIVMLASTYEEMGFLPPNELPAVHSMISCYIDDVDAHFARARAAGATVFEEPADQFYGDRTYRARDPEGHHWVFHQRVRDVSPEEMQAAIASGAE